jgi:uroporphyrinogen decarboxylase
MHDIDDHIANVWLAMLEVLFKKVKLDFIFFWEDMAYKNGPMISPAMFDTFVAPYYQRVTDFLKSRGCDIILVDTDGNCWELIPGFLKAGVTGISPYEVNAGMDIVKVRETFPELMMYGGLNKVAIASGKKAIDAELDTKLPPMLVQGRYIPCLDHLVPPNVSWENFLYYRERVNDYVQKYQKT